MTLVPPPPAPLLPLPCRVRFMYDTFSFFCPILGFACARLACYENIPQVVETKVIAPHVGTGVSGRTMGR